MNQMNKWIKPYISMYKGRIILTIVFGLLGVLSGISLLFVSGYLISKSALRPENVMMIYVPIVSVRAFSIGQAVFPYLDKLVSHDIVLRILSHLRDRLYERVEPQAMTLQEQQETGDLLAVLSNDIEHLQDLYIKTIFPSLLGITIYVLFALIFGFFDPIFMLFIILVLGIIVFLIPYISFKMMNKQHRDIKKSEATLYQKLTDSIIGQADWLASGRTNEVLAQFEKENDHLSILKQYINRWQNNRFIVLRALFGIVIVSVIIWTDGQTNSESISPTLIAAFVLMMFSVLDALAPLSDAVEEVPSYVESLRRIDAVTEYDVTDESSGRADDNNTNISLSLSNVSYSYPNTDKRVIDNLSLTINQGDKIAILGRSGTGKSTLLKMLSGLITPTSGQIFVNDEQISKEHLAKTISVLNQKPHLFATSIKNNIKIGKPDATDTEIKEVVQRAQLTHLIKQLPNGLDTDMEEFGKRFSGGERQRIAFARVLLQNTPIILLDEPTTGLDPITERTLMETIIHATSKQTIIWVTHHLIGAELMDQVIFLKDGKINIHGHHDELIQQNNYYRTLYEMDRGIVG